MSDQIKDLKKLCIFVKDADTDEKIRASCEKYGRLYRFNRHPNKHLAFALYSSESDAQCAKDGLKEDGFRAEFANTRRTPNDNTSDEIFRSKKSEFRSQQSLADCSENGYNEADSTSTRDDNKAYGACLKCGDNAFLLCGRCRDFYCSVDCQESDWLTHKRNCFPMPKLVPAKSTSNLRSSRANLANSTEKIRITEVNNFVKTIDATDGQAEIVQQLPREKIDDLPKKESDITSVANTSKADGKECNGIANATAMNGTASHTPPDSPNMVQSPRARLLSAQANDESNQSRPIQAKGLEMLSIANNSEIHITHVRNNKSIYIRDAATNDEYSQLLRDIDMASKTSSSLTTYPLKNDMVMAPFDGIYYRAVTISSDKIAGTVKVGFLDFGNSEEVLLTRLKELPEKLQNHRRLVFWVNLKDIDDDIEESDAVTMKKYLEEFMVHGKSVRVKSDKAEINQRDEVELFDMITNDSISDALNGLIKKVYRIEDLERKTCNGTDVRLMIIGGDKIHENYVTCLLDADIGQFMKVDEKIQSYGSSVKNAPAYKPKIKELCMVKIIEADGEIWYRCQYQQELVKDKVQVYSFDYGKIHKVHENNIRAMTSELAHEIITFVGYLKDGDKISNEQKQQLVDTAQFIAKSVEYTDDVHIITLDN